MAGAAGFALVLVLDSAGLLAGPVAVVLAALLLVLIPSARTLSRRFAVNALIALGFAPLMWWFPWPGFIAVSHSAVILAAGTGIVLYRLTLGAPERRGLLPIFRTVDLWPVAATVFAVVFFRPFFVFSQTISSVALLRQGFGGDNVAHFDMFEMIRRTGVTGAAWPVPADGSVFAYVSYPQHFHVLTAFAAELWAGDGVVSVDRETGLFGIGTAIVLTVALVGLVAAVAGHPSLRTRPGLVGLVTVAALAVLLLGQGSFALSYGFPGYLLAIIVLLAGVALAAGVLERKSAPTSNLQLLAVAGTAVVVAHSWSLLVPMSLVALVVVGARLPLRSYRARPLAAIPAVLIGLVTAAALAFAAWLVLAATAGSGSPEAALATPGGVPRMSIALTVVVALAVVVVALLPLIRRRAVPSRRAVARRPLSADLLLLAAVSAMGLAEAAVLIAIQLQRTGQISYFQYKFVLALCISVSVLFVLALALSLARRRQPERGVLRRSLAVLVLAGLALGTIVFAGLSSAPRLLITGHSLPGVEFRSNLENQAQATLASTERLVAAATVMAARPCAVPVYVAPLADDPTMDVSNGWAMSLSATWTEASSAVNTYLWPVKSPESTIAADANVVISAVLQGAPERCVVIAPAVQSALRPEIVTRFSGQIFSW